MRILERVDRASGVQVGGDESRTRTGPKDPLESTAHARRLRRRDPDQRANPSVRTIENKNMKALIAILCLCLAGAAGAVGGVLVTSSSSAPVDSTHALASASVAPNGKAMDPAQLVSRIESLNQEVADLHQEILRLKENANRAPAAAAVPVQLASEDNSAFALEHRDAILKIIAEDREALERQKKEEDERKQMEALLARADRTAKKLGMNATQQKALADVYVLERQKMDDMRNLRTQGDPEAARTAFQEFRTWRTDELTKRLGADLAQQVEESDVAMWRGFGRGGNGRNGGPQGGPGGGPGGFQGGFPGGPPGGPPGGGN
jgi:hypothetical protein